MRTRTILALLVAGGAIAVVGLASPRGDGHAQTAGDDTRGAAVAVRPTPPALETPAGDPVVRGTLDALGTQDQRQRAHFALVEALHRDPARTTAELERVLGGVAADQPQARVAIGALVAVGTPEIQAALVRVIEARDHDERFMELLLPSVGFLARPTPATETAVRSVSASRVPETVRTAADLTLGIMAGHLARVEPARAAAIVDGYAARLARATGIEERSQLLLVLGNAGTPAAGAAVATQLADPNPAVRSLAVAALRRVPTPEAEAQLTAALDDGDAKVRDSASRTLATRTVLLGR